jgi:predicted metal-binding membrane protein
MLALFVVGIMNLTWIVLLAAFVMLEKLSALGRVISRAGGAVMIGAGVYLVIVPWAR